MWTVPSHLEDHLTSYDSLADPHLAEYFRRPSVRAHLLQRGIITPEGDIVPDAKKRLSSDRRQQLQKILDELIESSPSADSSGIKDRETLVNLLDEKVRNEIQTFYEIKELERMVNAHLVMKAKKSYLKKQCSTGTTNGTKVWFAGQDDRQITLNPGNSAYVYQQLESHQRNATASRARGCRSCIKSNKGTQPQPQSLHSDATLQPLLTEDRPPSTYGLRRSRRNSITNGDAFFSSSDASLPLQTNNIATSGSNVSTTGKNRSGIDGKTSGSEGKRKENYNNNDHTAMGKEREEESPREVFSDILSLDGESLHGSSFDEGEKRLRGRHSCLAHRMEQGELEPAITTSGMRGDGGIITRHKRSTKDLDADEGEVMRMESSLSQLAKEEKKSISAQLTLRFEGMTRICERERRRSKRMGDCSNVVSDEGKSRMIKVSQQISRGASSFLVFSDDVIPGSDFKFYVYRRNNHPFSLCLFIDNVRDVRISTCCERKHQPGIRLGHFRIIDIHPFKDASTGQAFRCEACIKGISWNEWIRRSRRMKSASKVPLASPMKGTPPLTGEEGDKTSSHSRKIPSPSSSSVSSVPSISEMDYKEELEEYNRQAMEEYSRVSSAEAVTEREERKELTLASRQLRRQEGKSEGDLLILRAGERDVTLVSQKNEMGEEGGKETKTKREKSIQDTNNRTNRGESSNRVESIEEDVDSLSFDSEVEGEEVIDVTEGPDEEGGEGKHLEGGIRHHRQCKRSNGRGDKEERRRLASEKAEADDDDDENVVEIIEEVDEDDERDLVL